MAKAIKTICIEIIMYLTIVTMCGHVIVHFWDYYVTRSELSEMKKTLDSLKIALNCMGNGYNRLNDEFSEIVKEDTYNMPDSIHRYNAKSVISGFKKEPMERILKNIKHENGIYSVERSTFKDRPTALDGFSPIGRNAFKDNKISPKLIYSRRSDFSDVVGKPKMRCLCKHITPFYECYDDKNKNSYFELLK